MKKKVKKVYLISNGDFRDAVGVECWSKQKETLRQVKAALAQLGVKTETFPKYDPKRKHGFLTRQCYAAETFAKIDRETPVIIVLASWVYAHHVAGCLQTHKAPILLLANFDGTFPGLVSLLNHAGTFERLGIRHSRLWSESFLDDAKFLRRLATWCKTGRITYSKNHLADAEDLKLSAKAMTFGKKLAADILRTKRIMGQLDPGCMGMLNAVMDPAKLAGKIEAILNENGVDEASVLMTDYMGFVTLMQSNDKIYIAVSLVETGDNKYMLMVDYDGQERD